jgi:hypothetical protein
MSSALTLTGDVREVALAESQAVLALAQGGYREQLASLVSAVGEGEIDGEELETLEEVLELGLQSGRLRAVYGPGGEQAALRLYRRLPRGSALVASAEEVTDALAALRSKPIESISLTAVGPGAFALTVAAGGVELSLRLDRQGARLASVGV